MSPEEFAKKFLKDAEIPQQEEAGVKRVLEVLRSEPMVMNRALAPAGYENELLKNLRMKLPPEEKKSSVAVKVKEKRSLWIFSPGFSWSLSGTLAVAVAVLAIGYSRMKVIEVPVVMKSAESDFLVQAASKAPTREIASWVASVGDSATQIRVAQNDLTVVLEEAEKQSSPMLWEKIFNVLSNERI